MVLNYRDAAQKDLAEIIAIYNSTVLSRMVTADTEPVSIESRRQWFDKHSKEKYPLWIVENEHNEIIGWVSFQAFYGRPAYDATAEISIYLAAPVRGKGLGKQVLQHCIKAAAQLGIKTLLGYIFSHNEPSIKLFTNLGFKEWAHLPDVAVLDAKERSLKIFGKRIS